MTELVKGFHRDQHVRHRGILDDYIHGESAVHFIDAFV